MDSSKPSHLAAAPTATPALPTPNVRLANTLPSRAPSLLSHSASHALWGSSKAYCPRAARVSGVHQHHSVVRACHDKRSVHALLTVPIVRVVLKHTNTFTLGDVWQVVSGASYCHIVDEGLCVTDGSGYYGNYESCVFRPLMKFTLSTEEFETESCCDSLTVNGHKYSGSSGPEGVKVDSDSAFVWRSDSSATYRGFKVCARQITQGTMQLSPTFFCEGVVSVSAVIVIARYCMRFSFHSFLLFLHFLHYYLCV